jgi:hypothetical protein
MDKEGIIRLGGRLKFAELDEEVKHPIIIQASNLTERFIMDQHLRTQHGGVQETLGRLRSKVWILRGRQAVRKTIKTCLKCRKWIAKPAATIEGALPPERMQEAYPFSTTGIDFAGPIWVKNGRKKEKGYICLFTCAATRAVHLELTSTLGTKQFLLALRRFVARRGNCKTIYSDNAQAFRQSDRLLKASFQNIKSAEVQDFAAHEGISWRFIPPRAAWWGGFYERIVGSVKRHLRRVLGNALLDGDELQTILIEIEAAINARPLCSLNEDPQDNESLTPFHFLLGRQSQSLPDMIPGITTIPAKETLVKRWKYRKRLMDGFWRRWKEEYLLQLRTAHQVKDPDLKTKIKVGDLVLLHKELTPRGQWKMARVAEVHEGRDKQIRSVVVKTAKGNTFRRGLRHVCPLEISR